MKEIRREGERVLVEASLDELRLIVGAVNEALNGPFAVPTDQWVDLVGQAPERGSALLRSVGEILDR